MARTVIVRESGAGLTTLQAGTTGAFDAIPTGSLPNEAIGARVVAVAAPGRSFSAYSGNGIDARFDISVHTGAQLCGAVDATIRFSDFGGSTGAGHYAGVFAFVLDNASTGYTFGVSKNGHLWAGGADTGVVIGLYTAYEFQLAYSTSALGTGIYNILWQYRVAGSSTWVSIFSQTGKNFGGGHNIQQLGLRNIGVSETVYYTAQVSAIGLIGMSSLSDVGTPADLIDYVEQSYTFAGDPVNGNDSNDGVSAPIKTTSRLVQLLDRGVIPGTLTGFSSFAVDTDATGNVTYAYTRNPLASKFLISHATAATPWLVDSTLRLRTFTNAIEFGGASSSTPAYLDCRKSMSAGGFSLVSGIVYGSTDTQADSVLWENNVPLLSPLIPVISLTNGNWTESTKTLTAASGTPFSSASGIGTGGVIYLTGGTGITPGVYGIGSYNSSSSLTLASSPSTAQIDLNNSNITSSGSTSTVAIAYCQANPGAFFTDGIRMWMSASDSSNPATNGKNYQRSQQFLGGLGAMTGAVGVKMDGASDLFLHDLFITGTTQKDPVTGDGVGAYGIGDTVNGNNLLLNVTATYGSKHSAGWTGFGSGARMICDGCRFDQATPWAGFGGQSSFVIDAATGSGAGLSFYFLNVTCAANQMLPGSTAGAISTIYSVFINHGNTGIVNLLHFQDCNLTGANSFDLQLANPIVVRQSQLRGGGGSAIPNTATLTRNRWQEMPALGSGNFYNSLFASTQPSPNNSSTYLRLSGAPMIQGCTIDATAAGVGAGALLWRTGALSLTFEDNVVLLPSGLALISDIVSSDTIIADHNGYQTPTATQTIYRNTDFGSGPLAYSLAAAQAAGKESGSITAVNLGLSGSAFPQRSSPVVGLGAALTSLNGLPDYAGRSRPVSGNVDAGALQHVYGAGGSGCACPCAAMAIGLDGDN